jgi:hypothetical protein
MWSHSTRRSRKNKSESKMGRRQKGKRRRRRVEGVVQVGERVGR